jgi:excisionase family DNA binding protein
MSKSPSPKARPLPAGPQLLTKNELCQLVPCSAKFLESEVAAGRLRAHKISPKMVRFSMSDITEWLKSKAV